MVNGCSYSREPTTGARSNITVHRRRPRARIFPDAYRESASLRSRHRECDYDEWPPAAAREDDAALEVLCKVGLGMGSAS